VLPNAASATTSQALDASVVRGNTPLMAAAFYGRAGTVTAGREGWDALLTSAYF
jgi:hypothetical protein